MENVTRLLLKSGGLVRDSLTVAVPKLWENIEGWFRGALQKSPTKYQQYDIILDFDIWKLLKKMNDIQWSI